MPTAKWAALLALVGLPMAAAGQPTPATSAETRPATGFLHKTLSIAGETYAYAVYVPPDYTPDKPWPVILFLHGSGERGTDGMLQTDVGIGRALRRHHHLIPAVVVMPQCRPGRGWGGTMEQLAIRCLEQTSRQYRVDPERVYLTGLSMGGHGAWHMAARYPKAFAAVVPICGFAELKTATGAAKQLAPHLADLPIWCFHGESDTNVPVSRSREMVAAIREAGGTVKYTEYRGAKHFIWDRVYADRDLWTWLFAQHRPAADRDNPQTTTKPAPARNRNERDTTSIPDAGRPRASPHIMPTL